MHIICKYICSMHWWHVTYIMKQKKYIKSHMRHHVISDLHPKKSYNNWQKVTHMVAKVSHDVYASSDMVWGTQWRRTYIIVFKKLTPYLTQNRWLLNVCCWVMCCMSPPLSHNCGCFMITTSSCWDVVMPTATSTPSNLRKETTPSDSMFVMKGRTSWKSCPTYPSLFLQNWLRRYVKLPLEVPLFAFHPFS